MTRGRSHEWTSVVQVDGLPIYLFMRSPACRSNEARIA